MWSVVSCQKRKNPGLGPGVFTHLWRDSKGLALGRRWEKSKGSEAVGPLTFWSRRGFQGAPLTKWANLPYWVRASFVLSPYAKIQMYPDFAKGKNKSCTLDSPCIENLELIYQGEIVSWACPGSKSGGLREQFRWRENPRESERPSPVVTPACWIGHEGFEGREIGSIIIRKSVV